MTKTKFEAAARGHSHQRSARPSPPSRPTHPKAKVATKPPKEQTHDRESKQQRLIAMLRRPEGATIAQMAKAFEWQPHTVRGVISGSLKKRLGLSITSKKTDSGRIYRLA